MYNVVYIHNIMYETKVISIIYETKINELSNDILYLVTIKSSQKLKFTIYFSVIPL